MTSSLPSIERIADTFDLIEDWTDRYRYIIDLGRMLPPLHPEAKVDQNRVHGCVSQVWLVCRDSAEQPEVLEFEADSDAHIVRGLIAIALALFDGKSAREIATLDPTPILENLGLGTHLSPSRANGFASMIQRIRSLALARLKQRDASGDDPRSPTD